jgi:hypothetical protein
MLTELGYSYDFYDGIFPADYGVYDIIIQGMDGGMVTQIPELASYISAGGCAIIIGGSQYQPFALDVDAHLMDIDETNYFWTTVVGTPDITVLDPGHPLAAGLPSPYDFVDPSATYYMLRILDPTAYPVAVNGDGWSAIVTKDLGGGKFTWFINSPYELYYTDPGDYNYLKTYLGNAIDWCMGPVFEYSFQLSPYGNIIHVNYNPGGWLNGYMTLGPENWNPVLGKAKGGWFYMAIDIYPDETPGYYETMFLKGKISTREGEYIITNDGMGYDGPISVTLVPVAVSAEAQGPDITERLSTEVAPSAWYHFQMNPYSDVAHMNTNPGGWLNGYVDPYIPPAPLLGFAHLGKFYYGYDGIGTGYTLGFVAGVVPTRDGDFIATADGSDYIGPEYIWLTPVSGQIPAEGVLSLK